MSSNNTSGGNDIEVVVGVNKIKTKSNIKNELTEIINIINNQKSNDFKVAVNVDYTKTRNNVKEQINKVIDSFGKGTGLNKINLTTQLNTKDTISELQNFITNLEKATKVNLKVGTNTSNVSNSVSGNSNGSNSTVSDDKLLTAFNKLNTFNSELKRLDLYSGTIKKDFDELGVSFEKAINSGNLKEFTEKFTELKTRVQSIQSASKVELIPTATIAHSTSELQRYKETLTNLGLYTGDFKKTYDSLLNDISSKSINTTQFDTWKNKFESFKASLSNVKFTDGNAQLNSLNELSTKINSFNGDTTKLKQKVLELQSSFSNKSLWNTEDVNTFKSSLNDIISEFSILKQETSTGNKVSDLLNFNSLGDKTSEINTLENKLKSFPDVIENVSKETKDKFGNLKNNMSNTLTGIKDVLNEIEVAKGKVATNPTTENTSNLTNLISKYSDLSKAVTRYSTEMSSLNKQSNVSTGQIGRLNSLINNVNTFKQQNNKALTNITVKTNLDEVIAKAKELIRLGESGQILLKETNVAPLTNQFKTVKQSVTDLGLTGQTFLTRLKNQMEKLGIYMSGAMIFMQVQNQIRKMYQSVVELDSAMTELKKVTNETDAVYTKFLSNSLETSTQLGAKISDFVNATANFSRSGNNLADATTLAKTAIVYKQVGDDVADIDTASQSVISTMKAFNVQAQDSMSIADKFNEVSNNFAISSGGIGTALQKSASSMSSANNTLSETIGLIVAGNDVLQNPEEVGTGLKTLSMRVRGAKVDLESMGESTDGMCTSISELQAKVKGLSGVDIMADDKNFKSTYDILKDLSKVWGDLTDVNRASLTELIAGKRQGNLLQSIMTNFKDAENAVETANNSAGSAEKEHDTYMTSINGKLEVLQANYEALAESVMNSDWLKSLIDSGSQLLNILTQMNNITGTGGMALTTLAGILGYQGQLVNLTNPKESFGGITNLFKGSNTIVKDLTADYTKAQQALTGYNDIVQKSGISQTEFENCTKGVSNTLIQNCSATNSLEDNNKALNESFKNAKTSAMGFKTTLKSIGNALVSMGIMFAISTAISAISNAMEEASTVNQRAIDKADEVKKSQDDLKTSLTSNQNTVKSINSDFIELSKGVDNSGNNISLTSEQFDKYHTITQQIADMFPELVQGFDDLNNPIIKNTDNVNLLTDALKNQQDEYKNTLITQSDSLFSGFNSEKTGMDVNWKSGEVSQSGYDNQRKSLEQLLNSFYEDSENLKEKKAKFETSLTYSIDAMKAIITPINAYNKLNNIPTNDIEYALKQIGLTYDEVKQKFSDSLLNPDDVQKADEVNNIIQQINSQITTLKTTSQSAVDELKPTINALLEKNNGLTGDGLKITQGIVNSLTAEDFDKVDNNVNTLISNLQSTIVDELNGSNGQKIVKAYNDLFSLQDKYQDGKVTVSEYINGMKDILTNSNLSNDVKKYYENLFNTDEIGKKINNVKNRFNHSFDDKIDGLSIKDIDILYSIENKGQTSWSDIQKDVDEATAKAREFVSILDSENDSFKDLNKSIDDIQSAYDTTQSVIDDYNTNGYLTIDNVQSLIALGDDYVGSLINENGQLEINQDTYKKLVQSKLDNLKADALKNAIDTVKQIETEADAQQYLKGKIDKTTGATKDYTEATLKSLVAQKMALGGDIATAVESVYKIYQSYATLIDNTSTAYEQNKKSTDKTTSAIEEQENALENQQKSLEKQKDALEDNKKALEKQKDALNDEKDALEDEKQALEKSKQALEDKKNALNADKDSIEDLISITADYVKQTYEDKIQAINDEKDAYKEKIDATKEALQTEKDLHDYEESINSKNKDIATTKKQISALQGSSSSSARKQLQALKNTLSQQQQELADTQSNHSVDVRTTALDDEYNRKAKQWDKEVEKLQSIVSNERQIRLEAMALIDSHSQTFYNNLWNYVYQYTTKSKLEFDTLWNNAYTALDNYNFGQYTCLQILDVIQQNIVGVDGQIASLDGQILALNGQIDNLAGQIKIVEDNINGVADSINNVGTNIDTIKYKINDLKNAVDDATGATQTLGDAFNTIGIDDVDIVSSDNNNKSSALSDLLNSIISLKLPLNPSANNSDVSKYFPQYTSNSSSDVLNSIKALKLSLNLKDNNLSKYFPHYASGTSNSSGGLSIVDEDGLNSEFILKKQKGRATYLPEGSKVFNSKETDNLKNLANNKGLLSLQNALTDNSDLLNHLQSVFGIGLNNVNNLKSGVDITKQNMTKTLQNVSNVNTKSQSIASTVNVTVHNNGGKIDENKLADTLTNKVVKNLNKARNYLG